MSDTRSKTSNHKNRSRDARQDHGTFDVEREAGKFCIRGILWIVDQYQQLHSQQARRSGGRGRGWIG